SVAASLWGMVTPETLFSYHHGLGRVRIYPVFNSVKLVSNGPAQGGDATFWAAFLRRPRPGVRSAAGNEAVIITPVSLADDFHQHALGATPVEFAVEHLLPRTEVEPAGGDGDDDFAAHDLALQMRVGVILTGTVVPVGLWRGIERRELFQPSLVVLVQPRFVVVYENRGGDVHGVAQQQTLLHAAPGHTFRQPGGDVHKSHPGRHIEGKVFRERLHARAPA